MKREIENAGITKLSAGVDEQTTADSSQDAEASHANSVANQKSLKTPHQNRRKHVGVMVGAIAILGIIAVWGAYFFLRTNNYRATDDAYVHGNKIFLTPLIAGTVVAINADNTDLVHKGQPLVVLDDSDAKIQLEKAKAALGDTIRKVRQLYYNVSQMKANVDARSVELSKAEADYRRRRIVEDGSVSTEDVTHARQSLDSARDAVRVAEQKLDAAQALVVNTDLGSHPLVLQAEAQVLDADLALQRTVVYAPDTGYVARRIVQIGQRVTPGMPLLTIIPLNEIWVDANFKESDLRDVRIGQPVTLTSDFYGSSVKYKGRVLGLDAGTGASFALLPPDEASGNWIKIVQRVPVRIALVENKRQKYPLRVGLSMHAVIDTSNELGGVLSLVASSRPIYSTDIYSEEWKKANEMSHRLVETNLDALSHLPGNTLQTSLWKGESHDE